MRRTGIRTGPKFPVRTYTFTGKVSETSGLVRPPSIAILIRWLAIGGLLAVPALLLVYTALSARTAEISYGE